MRSETYFSKRDGGGGLGVKHSLPIFTLIQPIKDSKRERGKEKESKRKARGSICLFYTVELRPVSTISECSLRQLHQAKLEEFYPLKVLKDNDKRVNFSYLVFVYNN